MLRLDKSFILAFEVIVHHPEELLHYRRIACAVRRGDGSDARQFLRGALDRDDELREEAA